MKAILLKSDFIKKIEYIIQNKRKAFELQNTQDLIRKGKKLSFIKDIVVDDKAILVKLKGTVDSSTIPLADSKTRKEPPKDYRTKWTLLRSRCFRS